MGKALVIKNADFENYAISGDSPIPTISGWYGLTSANFVGAGDGGDIFFMENTILKDKNGTYLQGKSISKIIVWVRSRNQQLMSIDIGYLPSGWTSVSDFVVMKSVDKDSLNLTFSCATEFDVETGMNVIDLNAAIPSGALFGIRVNGVYIPVRSGGNAPAPFSDWTNISTNGTNRVGWTPAIDFYFG